MDTQIIINILIYILVIFFILKRVIPSEIHDLNCPEGPDTKDKSVCKDGKGKLSFNYRYKKGDTITNSIEKISILNANYRKDVIWRRYITLSFIASILVFIIAKHSLPSGIELIGSMLSIMCVFYFAHSYYGFHHYRFIESAIDEHLKFISKHIIKK